MGQRMLKVAIVGAETLPGRDLLEGLLEDAFPMEEPELFTLGEEEETAILDEEEVQVLPLERGGLADRDLVFLLPGARPPAERLDEALRGGGIVLDAAGDAGDAPLIFPGQNDEDLDEHPEAHRFALPTPIASQLAAALLPIEARAGIRSVEAVALLPAAGAGLEGIDELSRQTIDLLSGREPARKVFGQRLAFNLVPLVGHLGEAGETDAESTALSELGRLLGREVPGHLVAAWAPLFHGNTLFVSVQTERALDREGAMAALREAEGVEILDDPAHQVAPMPMLAVGDARVHVGRIRSLGDRLHFMSVADGLRFGVATPLRELARELLRRGRFAR